MSKPFLGIMEKVAQNVGRYNYDTESVDLGTQRLIIASFNEAQEYVSRTGEAPSLFTTTSVYLETDTYAYDFEDFDMTDNTHIYSIKLWDDDKYLSPMLYVTTLIWDQKIAPYIENTSGKPEMYTYYNKVLYFSRKPDDDYLIEIRFQFEAAKVLNSDSDIDIDEYESGLTMFTTALTWLKLEEVEMYKEYKKMAGDLFKPFKDDIRSEPTSRSSAYVGKAQRDYPSNFWNDPFVKRVR